MNSRRILSQVALVAGTLLLSIGVQTFAQFTPPTTSPPNADAYAPLNTGPNAQSKVGGLLLNTGSAVNGLIVQNGNVGIGTINPFQKLEVAGFVKGTGLCIGTECITSWPASMTAASSPAVTVYSVAAGCGTYTSTQSTCVTPNTYFPAVCRNYRGQVGPCGSPYYPSVTPAYYNTYNCAGTAITSGSPITCLNTPVGNLVASTAANNTVTVWRPSTSQTISCTNYTTSSARYDAATNRYFVSGDWAAERAVSFGQNVQGCYPAGGCGEAQTNQSVNQSVTTTYSRNSSGGVTTTITHQVYLSGSYWLNNGRGSGTCGANFTS